MKELYQKLRTFTGKSYGLYKSLAGKTWNFGDFDMEFVHVQGDPYAPASRLKLTAPIEILGIPAEWGNSPVKRLALADYLLRKLSAEVEKRSEEEKFPIHKLCQRYGHPKSPRVSFLHKLYSKSFQPYTSQSLSEL